MYVEEEVVYILDIVTLTDMLELVPWVSTNNSTSTPFDKVIDIGCKYPYKGSYTSPFRCGLVPFS